MISEKADQFEQIYLIVYTLLQKQSILVIYWTCNTPAFIKLPIVLI